jgi:hypothetical protein
MTDLRAITPDTLKQCIIDALKQLIKEDALLIKNSLKEECINHKLAQHIEKELNSREIQFGSVDIEYDKYLEDAKELSTNDRIRPDILVHKRVGGNQGNLIVIEAKKYYSRTRDREKVMRLVDGKEFRYTVGAVISYLPAANYIKLSFYHGRKWREAEKIPKPEEGTPPASRAFGRSALDQP